MKTICPHCHQNYDVPDDYLQQEVTCEKCQKNFVVTLAKSCSRCNAENSQQAFQCWHCHSEFKTMLEDDSKDKQSYRKKYLKIVLLLVSVLILGGAAGAYFHWKSMQDPAKQLAVGKEYLTGKAKNIPKGIQWLEKSAEQENFEAMLILGKMYLAGNGIANNPERANFYLSKLAEQNSQEALVILGKALLSGENITQNAPRGAEYLKRVADAGDNDIQFLLAVAYGIVPFGSDSPLSKYRDILPPDSKLAEEYLRKAAGSGKYGEWYYILANLCRENDLAEAIRLYNQAGDKNFPKAYIMLGRMFAFGLNGLKRDYKIAEEYYLKAINLGAFSATAELSKLYAEGGWGLEKNTEKALEVCNKGVENGSPEAQVRLGDYYREGTLVAKDYDKAMHLYQEAAKKNPYRGYSAIARCYMEGSGVEKDIAKAIDYYWKAQFPYGLQEILKNKNIVGHKKYNDKEYQEYRDKIITLYTKAAELGDVIWQQELAEYYWEGIGGNKNQQEAFKWFSAVAKNKKASDFARRNALECLGDYYKEGYSGSPDYAKAVDCYWKAGNAERLMELLKRKIEVPQIVNLFQMAADKDDSEWQYRLAECYLHGIGIKQNSSTAISLLEKAAKQDYVKAQFLLGEYYTGKYTKHSENQQKSISWFRAAADGKYAPAQCELGKLYAQGKVDNLGENHYEAAKLFKLAADQGYAEAKYELGIAYAEGHGVEKDMEKSYNLVKEAADDEFPDAQCLLGELALKDNRSWEAFNFFRDAAAQGHDRAQFLVGLCYIRGIGTIADKNKAIEYFLKSSEQGNADAMLQLGCFYDEQKDFSEAVKWFEKAAQKGNTNAQFNLAICHLEGEGTRKDIHAARHWLRTASEKGHEKAKELLEKLNQPKAGASGRGGQNQTGTTYPITDIYGKTHNVTMEQRERYKKKMDELRRKGGERALDKYRQEGGIAKFLKEDAEKYPKKDTSAGDGAAKAGADAKGEDDSYKVPASDIPSAPRR